MKAVTVTKYGPPEVLKLTEIEKPIPKENEILVKIHATSVSMGDCEMRSLNMPFALKLLIRIFIGFRKPRKTMILGQEIAGIIESVGENVTNFKPGEEVFGQTGFSMGGYAEYIIFSKEALLSIKPVSMTYEEAAVLPVGGFNSLHFLRQANIKTGQKVLINGAGGSIGTIAVQLAKYYGAKVTAVDSTEKLEMLRSIGADHVVDYRTEDFSTNKTLYDVIFDVVGKASYSGCVQSLKENGFFLVANPSFKHHFCKRWTKKIHNKTVIAETVEETTKDLIFLSKLVENGEIKPIIDRSYSLEQSIDAHHYVETGTKKGNVVIKVI
jgi:NADPH:quinone reductase-like Zn-dependent oxidoreductase